MVPPPEKPKSDGLGGMGTSKRYAGIGIQAGGSVVFYLLIGLLLDNWLNTFPWLMLVGIFIGVAGMFALLFRMSSDLDRQHGSPKEDS